MRQKRLVVACAAALGMSIAGSAQAQQSTQDMMRQIENLQQQIDALKSQLQQVQATAFCGFDHKSSFFVQ